MGGAICSSGIIDKAFVIQTLVIMVHSHNELIKDLETGKIRALNGALEYVTVERDALLSAIKLIQGEK